MSGHTPGPWEWDGDHNTTQELRAPGSAGLDDRCVLIAECYAGESFIEISNEANARLIAAAPQLLEACKAARLALALLGPPLDSPQSESTEHEEEWRATSMVSSQLAAAIAAAEGE